jgi:hypothetical protein
MRPRRVLLVLAILLLPVALAQVPSQPQPCGPIAMTLAPPANPIPPGGRATIAVSLENDGQVAADVTVAVAVRTQGWALLDPSSRSVEVAAGQSAAMNFTVQAEDGAAQDGEVDFSGQADCAPGGLPTACPRAELCVYQLRADTAVLDLQEASGFRIPGLDDFGFPIELLLAGVLLIAIPFAVRKKRPAGPTLATPEPLKRVKPGRGTSFPLEFGNPGPEPVRLALALSALPHGWSAMLPMPEIQLASKEKRALWLMVRSPPEARSGDTAEILLTATDPRGRERSIKLRADVDEAATDQG